MSASGERRARRGPAPIASFDHDVSDESSPEVRPALLLPEIREDPASCGAGGGGARLAVSGEGRARSHSTPGLSTPAAPRIDISRASSSSHHDSRDSSPELALFAGAGDDPRHALSLGFREDGALDLRSSTEELAFLEGAPPAPPPASAGPAPPAARRHSRKDSQGSEAALLAVSGRTSRVSSVGSQCSALSAFSHASRVSHLSVVSGASRSPSPHKMLLETSFCGPKPIDTDPDICAAAVEDRLLQMAQLTAPLAPAAPPDARDRREVRTEVTVETTPGPPAPPAPAPAPAATPADEKNQKECRNRARAEECRGRPRVRRQPSQPEVYDTRNRSKDIIRIKLKPDEEYDDDDDEESERTLRAGVRRAERPRDLVRDAPPSPSASRRTPSPGGLGGAAAGGAGGAVGASSVSRKSSFCSLFKSRETIGSPDSPSEAQRRKKSLTEGRSRSKSRDRSATPSSAGKLRGSVLSLFKTPRRSATSPAADRSRAASPALAPPPAVPPPHHAERLKYYEAARDGIIHIPLRTPPDERPDATRSEHAVDMSAAPAPREPARPASAPAAPPGCDPTPAPARSPHKPLHRTVLPDGSIIIPLHSPTESTANCDITQVQVEAVPAPAPPPTPDALRCYTAVVEASPVRKDEPVWSEPERPHSSAEGTSTGTCGGAGSGECEPAEPAAGERGGGGRRRERLVFTTHVGSTEQVFSTQLSITKTPSVTSEISGSFPSFHEEVRSPAPALRDTHITSCEPAGGEPGAEEEAECCSSLAATPHSARDSSGSEPSSETGRAGAAGGGGEGSGDTEARGLVVGESFEEELPYVPTTLPLERSLALPMVPVRDRTPHQHALASVSRPRGGVRAGPPRAPPPPPPPAAPRPPHHDKLRIRLPRQTRAPSAPSAPPPPTRTTRPRTASQHGVSEGAGAAGGGGGEWIDFSEVPERRKQPRRIQALPAAAVGADAVMFSYVEPEECRCECHAHNDPPNNTHTPPEGATRSPRSPRSPRQHHRIRRILNHGSDSVNEGEDCVHRSSPDGVGGAGCGEAGPAGGAGPFAADLHLSGDHQHDYDHDARAAGGAAGGGAARRQ